MALDKGARSGVAMSKGMQELVSERGIKEAPSGMNNDHVMTREMREMLNTDPAFRNFADVVRLFTYGNDDEMPGTIPRINGAIKAYMQDGEKGLQSWISGHGGPTFSREGDLGRNGKVVTNANIADFARTYTTALQRAPAQSVMMRGLANVKAADMQNFNNMKPGNIIDRPRIDSYTRNGMEGLRDMDWVGRGRNNVVINVRRGRGIYIDAISGTPGEGEIFSSGRFKVVSVKTNQPRSPGNTKDTFTEVLVDQVKLY